MIRIALLSLVFLFALPAFADESAYSLVNPPDLTQLIAPPPESGSAEEKRDLDAVMAAQASRTFDEITAAQADATISIFRFADVLGPGFTPERLPLTAHFFARVDATEWPLLKADKEYWHRPRPYILDPDVQPVVDKPNNDSYPSGHATFGYLTAILLADMLPEKRVALFARGRLYGDERVIAGAHYPTDVEAGRIAATVIAAALMENAEFREDLEKAKEELQNLE
jgi:acid phosphatase (class A)